MRRCPQSSQASTCPPSAAVRHCSIADITLSWARLRCPAWAARYPGPAARRMSATSSEARTGSAGGCDLSHLEQAELVERAHHGAHRAGRDLGVECRVLELRVAEQDLDHPDVGAVLEQVGGEAVAECVRADPLGNVGRLRRLDDDAVELPGADRLACVLPRKQPAVAVHDALLTPGLPPLAQQGEQIA